ncbi:hypothetical protein YC2023_099806 [Brassica napus]
MGLKALGNVVTTDLLRISSCRKVDPCTGPEKLMRSCPALESLQLTKCCLNDKEGMRASWGIIYFIFVGSLSWTRETSEALASSASSEGRAYKCIMGFIFKWDSLRYMKKLNLNHLLENASLCLSSSSNRHSGVRHSTFESLRLSRSSQSIASGFLCFWDSLDFKKDMKFVGITVLFLDEKVPSFEVARCSSMYKITDHPFLIRFISLTIIDEVITVPLEINLQSRLDYVVRQIRSIQGSDLTKETTRVVIRLLIDP